MTDIVREVLQDATDRLKAWRKQHGTDSMTEIVIMRCDSTLAALSEREKTEDELINITNRAIAEKTHFGAPISARIVIRALSDAGVLAVRK